VDPAATPAPDVDPDVDPGDGLARGAGRGVTPLVAPVPFKHTQLGWGLALMFGVIHRFDADTAIKPSTGAVGGFYSENGSWGVMAMEMARLGRDAWRLRAMASHVDVRYDFYGIGDDAGDAGYSIGVQQELNFVAGMALRRVTSGLYLGPVVTWMQSTVKLRDSSSTVSPPVADLARTNLFAPGIQAEVDTRDDDYWPTVGSVGRLRAFFFSSALGGSRNFQRYVAMWSWYGRLRGEALVLAANANVCVASGDAPFYALCALGMGRGGLRGYTQGRYRDTVMTTVQAELRYHTTGRFGATAFAGFGQVAPSAGAVFAAQVLPAGGAGLRFQLTRRYPMHLRLDYAWGRNGGLLYFGVTEAF
jgi:hypothetical protein